MASKESKGSASDLSAAAKTILKNIEARHDKNGNFSSDLCTMPLDMQLYLEERSKGFAWKFTV